MAYQTVKELTNTEQRRVSVIQDKAGKCLTEEHEVLTCFTEYCSDLYNHESYGDTTILNGPYDTNNDKSSILREEVEAAVKCLKGEKSPEDDTGGSRGGVAGVATPPLIFKKEGSPVL